MASFAAPHVNVGSPYPEVTDAVLPSSLSRVISFVLVFSTHLLVLVCGTVNYLLSLDAFPDTGIIVLSPTRVEVSMHHLSRTLTDLPIRA